MTAPSATISDDELLELARRGDRAAFESLLARHDERMRGLAYRLVADRPGMDEALLEAYVAAYRGLPALRPGKDFGDWLYRLTYNACIDEIRRRRDDLDVIAPAPSGGPLSTSEMVRTSLAELPPSQRVTVVLVDGEGFHHAEVAEILGVAPGTVSSRLYRARTKLRRRLWDEVR
ncbi:MAG TPA: sigma-70 family RNA polymerase sigma factor [Acidimicrobiales bacterium]|nr:sigma-70 family RNA polymerase sigma factor [Acidimicrobiales bacterium]